MKHTPVRVAHTKSYPVGASLVLLLHLEKERTLNLA